MQDQRFTAWINWSDHPSGNVTVEVIEDQSGPDSTWEQSDHVVFSTALASSAHEAIYGAAVHALHDAGWKPAGGDFDHGSGIAFTVART
jgi:hypothetical protein